MFHPSFQMSLIQLSQNTCLFKFIKLSQYPKPSSLRPGEFIGTHNLISCIIQAVKNPSPLAVLMDRPIGKKVVFQLFFIKTKYFFPIHSQPPMRFYHSELPSVFQSPVLQAALHSTDYTIQSLHIPQKILPEEQSERYLPQEILPVL